MTVATDCEESVLRKRKPFAKPTEDWRRIGTADIFRGIMVSLYVKEKENGHVQAYAPTGALSLDQRYSLTSKLDGYPTG